MKILILTCTAICCLLSVPAATAQESLSEKLIAKAQTRHLDLNPRWRSLVHYESSLWGGLKSAVDSSDFFLAPDGKTNPQAELQATLRAFFDTPGADQDLHAQCRFPARLNWLKRELAWDAKTLPRVKCERFAQFSFQGNIESVSLIFATGYLSNPASYFGHPFIKFNLPRSKITNSLLDTAVNYGAMTPPGENPVVYAVKGLFGGYNASFTHRQFFYSTHAYAELELRDLWDYRLNLSPEQVQQVVGHIWEVLGRNFDYLFLTENCATSFARLIGDEIEVKLIPGYLPYSLPYTLFDHLAHDKDARGQPLISSVQFIPSRQSRLTAGFWALNKLERAAVDSVARANAKTDRLENLPPESKARVIETLFDYYSYRAAGNPPDEKLKSFRRELVSERLKLPISNAEDKPSLSVRPPHEGQKPLLTRIGFLSSVRNGAGGEFRLRPASHDHLASDIGRPQNSSVQGFDLTMRFLDHKFSLRRFDIISVETLNISQTGLPGDGGMAWRFSTGFEEVNLACTECAVYKIEAGIGKAWQPIKILTYYIMADARLQSAAAGSGHLAGTPWAGAIADILPSGFWRTGLSLGYRDYLGDRNDGEAIFKVENRFGRNREWDIRIAYEKHVDEQTQISYSRYW
jgi:hypothetical protein